MTGFVLREAIATTDTLHVSRACNTDHTPIGALSHELKPLRSASSSTSSSAFCSYFVWYPAASINGVCSRTRSKTDQRRRPASFALMGSLGEALNCGPSTRSKYLSSRLVSHSIQIVPPRAFRGVMTGAGASATARRHRNLNRFFPTVSRFSPRRSGLASGVIVPARLVNPTRAGERALSLQFQRRAFA